MIEGKISMAGVCLTLENTESIQLHGIVVSRNLTTFIEKWSNFRVLLTVLVQYILGRILIGLFEAHD